MTAIELQALRRLLFLTVSEAAQGFNVSSNAWGQYERGDRGIPVSLSLAVSELVQRREKMFDAMYEQATGQGGALKFKFFETVEQGEFNSVVELRAYQSAVSQLLAAGLCTLC